MAPFFFASLYKNLFFDRNFFSVHLSDADLTTEVFLDGFLLTYRVQDDLVVRLKFHFSCKNLRMGQQKSRFPAIFVTFSILVYFVNISMGHHWNQLAASNSTWYSRSCRLKFQISHKIQRKGKQNSAFSMFQVYKLVLFFILF